MMPVDEAKTRVSWVGSKLTLPKTLNQIVGVVGSVAACHSLDFAELQCRCSRECYCPRQPFAKKRPWP